ncbi:four-carbon acid sugar kinase family protein [Oceanicella sp. SM1341]|uniref:four-carbon acid sugar kinase family protein n=1 Tax=Oceanicella sp. SM1341 TaxID=1548889 RepID=UPI001E2EF1D2|nr:four-carbon acid sugar kinase family protein [Oceanicella sp. SM1341]
MSSEQVSETRMESPDDTLPEGLLLAWYGDDFTGAAAVMEVLAFAGLPALLFLAPPDAARLARYPGLRAVGVASTARAQDPAWMEAHLPGAFAALHALGAPLLHYKVCSTLDSAPRIGSIGKATEIGADLSGARVVPVLVAAPQMRRYQAFGHLFAGMGAEVFRLDRHPVMARHPVTPMTEADVARHIALQSPRLAPSCLTLEALAAGARLPAPPEDGRIALVTLDSMDAGSEAAAGRLIWEARGQAPFVVGSQGVEYALVGHWQAQGWLAPPAPVPGIGRGGPMVTVSGSVSPTTAEQIGWSRRNSFACIPFDAARACTGGLEAEVERVATAALEAIAAGQDPLIHTAEGPDDPAVTRFRAALATSGLTAAEANRRTGAALGRALAQVLERSGARRAVVSGGDTSGFATAELGIFALEALAPTIPGAALFRAHADGPADGLELALKGGQMGSPDYFGWVRDGGGAR